MFYILIFKSKILEGDISLTKLNCVINLLKEGNKITIYVILRHLTLVFKEVMYKKLDYLINCSNITFYENLKMFSILFNLEIPNAQEHFK